MQTSRKIAQQRVVDRLTYIRVQAALRGETLAAIARAYGCSTAAVHRTLSGRSTSRPLIRYIEQRYNLRKGTL